VGLFAFTWLELVAPERATLPVLQSGFALYVVILGFGAVLFGDRWFTAADPFEAYALLMARLSPLGRRSDGAIVVPAPAGQPRRPHPAPRIGRAGIGAARIDGLRRVLQLQFLDRLGAEHQLLHDTAQVGYTVGGLALLFST
jgi:hypothetical protein